MGGVNSLKNSNSFELFSFTAGLRTLRVLPETMDVLGATTDLQPRALEEYQFRVMANPNDALLFWSDHGTGEILRCLDAEGQESRRAVQQISSNPSASTDLIQPKQARELHQRPVPTSMQLVHTEVVTGRVRLWPGVNLDDSGCRRSWLLTVLRRFSAVLSGRLVPGGWRCCPMCSGRHRLRLRRGGPPFRVAGTGVAGQAGAGRAHSRCQQVRKASFQGQVRLIFSMRARAWRASRAGRLSNR